MIDTMEYITALDLGTSQVSAAMGRLNERNELEIIGAIGLPSAGMRKGSIVNIEEATTVISQVLSKLENQTGRKVQGLVSGIGGQQVKLGFKVMERKFDSHQHEIKAHEVDEMLQSLRNQSSEPEYEILSIVPSSYRIDGELELLNPAGTLGKSIQGNYHLILARELAMQQVESAIQRSGFELQEIFYTPLAEAAVSLNEDEKEAGVALVNFGGGSTEVSIYLDKRLIHTAIIPFGGEIITHDIKEGCSVLQRQAEMLKVQFGSSLAELSEENKVIAIPGISGRKPKEISFRNLAYIIQARMEEILDAVNIEIEKSGVADRLAAGMVISGGGAQLLHLSELINIKTGYDVRIAFSDQSDSSHSNSSFSGAIGLLHQGIQHIRKYAPAAENKTQSSNQKPKKVKEAREESKLLSRFKMKINTFLDEVEKNVTP